VEGGERACWQKFLHVQNMFGRIKVFTVGSGGDKNFGERRIGWRGRERTCWKKSGEGMRFLGRGTKCKDLYKSKIFLGYKNF